MVSKRGTARQLMGAVLRELRERAGLDHAQFGDAIESLSRSEKTYGAVMVKGVESGNSAVPKQRANAYFKVLTAYLGRGSLNHRQFMLALATANHFDLEDRAVTDEQFDWEGWLAVEPDVAKRSLIKALKAQPQEAVQANAIVGKFNAVQLELVRQITEAMTTFGNTIISDEALASWEFENRLSIRSVRAIVNCLGSETSKQFLDSMSALILEEKFRGYQYIVARAGDAQAVRTQWDELINALARKRKSDTNNKRLDLIRARMRYASVAPETLAEACKLLSNGNSALWWDCIYYYECEGNHPGLLVGVFRRFGEETLGKARSVQPPLGTWDAIPMNEALEDSLIPPFERWHSELWSKLWGIKPRRASRSGRRT